MKKRKIAVLTWQNKFEMYDDQFKDEFSNQVYYQEYLVVTYDGGAIGVRSCNGNSFTAIFEELTKMLDGGYYDEVQDLHDYENDAIWKEVSLEELEEDYKWRD